MDHYKYNKQRRKTREELEKTFKIQITYESTFKKKAVKEDKEREERRKTYKKTSLCF